MKENKSKEKLKGSEGFESYYTSIYNDRWPVLKESLFAPSVYIKYNYGGQEDYFLDPGSVCAALSLPVEGAEKILDLCAAPGGKTLVVASCMDEEAILYSNERSSDRKARLVKVVNTVLREDVSARIVTSCSDGATWCRRETESFDRILLDAPCSSERHVLQDEKYLKDWSPSRIKTLSMEQWALLSSAWRLLKKDGYIVYATCALANQENDQIIDRLLKKFDDVEIVDLERVKEIFTYNLSNTKAAFTSESGIDVKSVYDKIECTEHGFHVLPDTCLGAGPLYFCLIHKKCL